MNPSITVNAEGRPVAFDGREAVEVFRLRCLASSIRFEINCPGMRLHRGPLGSTVARKQYGLRGNKQRLLEQVEALYDKALAAVPVVTEAR